MRNDGVDNQIDRLSLDAEARMIGWRRDLHANPELANAETRTAGIVAAHLRAVGCDEVRTGLGGSTGVVGILRGGMPGPVVGLRADMDALPIREETGLPFASNAEREWGGRTVPAMHACGHDVHTAILMAVADVAAQMRDELRGTLVFLFQQAEEGPSSTWSGESGAARLVAEGALDEPRPDAMFALHVVPGPDVRPGHIIYHTGDGSYAMSVFRVQIRGVGGHAMRPWDCKDPIGLAAQVILALQGIPNKDVDVYNNHVTVSLGAVQGGDKFNVIPGEVVIEGALRFTDEGSRAHLEHRVEQVAAGIAASGGARAEVDWRLRVPILFNHPALTAAMVPSLAKAAGSVKQAPAFGLDDFSHFSQMIPSLFFALGVAPAEGDDRPAGGLHTPDFRVNEDAMLVGLRALLHLSFDYPDRAPRSS